MAAKIRTGDKVIVICGSYRGKVGKVLKVKNDTVQVEGVNVMVKHRKPNNTTKEPGRLGKICGFIHVSNIAHASNENKPIRVCFVYKNGIKYLVNKKDHNQEIRKV